jgi:catechol 2,3-dioxygenase-like lactoylglutathione lyase family enzyme
VAEELIPIFRVADATITAAWYERMGFVVAGEHRFAPGLPLYLFLERNGVQLHLSEHTGDAPPRSLAYFWVDDVDAVATAFGAEVEPQPWGREIELTDPDGNRVRVATPHSNR